MITDDRLRELLTIAHNRAEELPWDTDGGDLFDDGAQAASNIPEPLGSAIAAVLALAAYEYRVGQHRTIAGQSKTTLALALAAQEYAASIRKLG